MASPLLRMTIVRKDRRRYVRVGAGWEVSLEAPGIRWQGKTVDLGPYGAKVTLPPTPVTLPVRTRVELRLALPGQDSPLSLTAIVVRVDPDGVALNFVKQGAVAFARLKGLVDSLRVSVRPQKDRRRAPRADAELDIRLDAEAPRSCEGLYKTIDLSTSGVKVAWPVTVPQPSWGTSVQLSLAGPDGQRPLSLKGLVWRREPDSIAFLFVELEREQVECLKALVESLRG